MSRTIESIIRFIAGVRDGDKAPYHICISDQFQPLQSGLHETARNLNAAFLILLSGRSHRRYEEASLYLDGLQSNPLWEKTVRFFRDGLMLVSREISDRCSDDADFAKDLINLDEFLRDRGSGKACGDVVERVWRVFFPEGISLTNERSRGDKIIRLREKRKIAISRLNECPVGNPAREILFTSNILVTLPVSSGEDNLPANYSLRQRLAKAAAEEQMYWYDHPVPIGVPPEHNEVLYGLEGLDEAVQFEKDQGTVEADGRCTCVLSVSVTHRGLQDVIKQYLEDEFEREKNIRHLDVYVFTESDTRRMIKEILSPAAKRYLSAESIAGLSEVLGVDGEYGRHFTFLKAIAAFWQVFINPEIKGTFKIDLDQVFPQKELVEQSGISALEHLKTSLWGAEGIDGDGNRVEFGMIAGALVNKEDIESSLYTPDVRFPSRDVTADELIFFSQLTQALSTEAEIMTRYADGGIDGERQCIQRIHVTGGTCGILIDSLRKHRPFTPSFIGRAEDQAYLLSVLFEGHRGLLRYVHKDGLIMRHDKKAFAAEAIQRASLGKLVGDYVRILLFSYYVKALPWSPDRIKDAIDPFTGCFVSKIPLTVVYLRFALKTASFFAENTREKNHRGSEFLRIGTWRLHEAVRMLTEEPESLVARFEREKNAWKIYYDILDAAEQHVRNSDAFALKLREKARSLVGDCRISLSGGSSRS